MNVTSTMQEITVLYQENHAGTFNGCLETIMRSLDQLIMDKVRELVPNVVLDHRTQLGHCLTFLRGQAQDFIISGINGSYFLLKKLQILPKS